MDHAIAYNVHVVLLSFIQLVSVVMAVMGWIAIGEVNRGMSVFPVVILALLGTVTWTAAVYITIINYTATARREEKVVGADLAIKIFTPLWVLTLIGTAVLTDRIKRTWCNWGRFCNEAAATRTAGWIVFVLITLEILFLLYVRRNPEWNARAIGTGGHHLIASEDEESSPAYRDESDRDRSGVISSPS
ncbi:hypothetical protein FFLO_03973 [Filobasidium floriforme]|uniref:MARVEL domain-containing protein n=1 Tax=Filobasidium floriforme TaxID=5210 RepID=A0A8K0NQA7_9TREE|nr:hypothetical protein FFLO_03973 [Filobasidium floriforme]